MNRNIVCEAQAGNTYATEIVYLRYKPFVEFSVNNRKLLYRVEDYSIEVEDIIQDVWFESMNTAILHFDLNKFMNSKKKNVDDYFKTSINYTINKWLKVNTCWKRTPFYIDSSGGTKKYLKSAVLQTKTGSINGGALEHILCTNDLDKFGNLLNEVEIIDLDTTNEYKELKDMVLEQVLLLVDESSNSKSKSDLVFNSLSKPNIMSLLDMKFSGYIYREIAESIGLLLNDLVYFFHKYIKPAVLLVLDNSKYYAKYIKTLNQASVSTIRRIKGDNFVKTVLKPV